MKLVALLITAIVASVGASRWVWVSNLPEQEFFWMGVLFQVVAAIAGAGVLLASALWFQRKNVQATAALVIKIRAFQHLALTLHSLRRGMETDKGTQHISSAVAHAEVIHR